MRTPKTRSSPSAFKLEGFGPLDESETKDVPIKCGGLFDTTTQSRNMVQGAQGQPVGSGTRFEHLKLWLRDDNLGEFRRLSKPSASLESRTLFPVFRVLLSLAAASGHTGGLPAAATSRCGGSSCLPQPYPRLAFEHAQASGWPVPCLCAHISSITSTITLHAFDSVLLICVVAAVDSWYSLTVMHVLQCGVLILILLHQYMSESFKQPT